jgi:hypothetical protein
MDQPEIIPSTSPLCINILPLSEKSAKCCFTELASIRDRSNRPTATGVGSKGDTLLYEAGHWSDSFLGVSRSPYRYLVRSTGPPRGPSLELPKKNTASMVLTSRNNKGNGREKHEWRQVPSIRSRRKHLHLSTRWTTRI